MIGRRSRDRSSRDDGFDEFCQAQHGRLVGMLSLMTGNRSVAEDLAQETWARTWERWTQVRAMESPQAWVMRVAANLATSSFRRRAAERRALDRLPPEASSPPIDLGLSGFDAAAVRTAIARLPARQAQALVLRYYLDLSVEETAATMGCATGTVKAHVHRAIEELRSGPLRGFRPDLEEGRGDE